MAEDESFARRWSRLKQQARQEDTAPGEAPASDPPATSVTDTAPPAEEAKPEEKPFDLASLPPVDSLTSDSDYSVFMRPEVPEDLRQKALRRLWATDAILSAPDPLDMHNIDYNAVPTFPDGFKSLQRVAEEIAETLDPEKDERDTAAESTSPPPGPPPETDAAPQHANQTEIKDSPQDKS